MLCLLRQLLQVTTGASALLAPSPMCLQQVAPAHTAPGCLARQWVVLLLPLLLLLLLPVLLLCRCLLLLLVATPSRSSEPPLGGSTSR
jgi:hypothetical protein